MKWAIAPLASVTLASWIGCTPIPEVVVVHSSELVEVVARPSATDERAIAELNVRHAHGQWTLRTRIPELTHASALPTPAVIDSLRSRVVWLAPYLFIREDLGHQEASRGSVDHVFLCTTNAVHRLGTLSARFGPPGSQLQNGLFRDTYDRLEFSPLTARSEALIFDIYLRDHRGRFSVDSGITWSSGQDEYRRRLDRLRSLEIKSPDVATPASLREARALALFCLAFTRYCDRPIEHAESLEVARTALGPLDDILEEVETVQPGELAASRDEVLRANPSLVNFFKESSDQPPDPELPAPPESEPPAPGLTAP